MAIEKEKITNKLKDEGIDEKFGNGVSFETEEELNKWVDGVKTLMVKPKAIEEYSLEELETILKDPQPKAKGLQAIADKIRTEAKKKYDKTPPAEPPKKDEHELPDDIKAKFAEVS